MMQSFFIEHARQEARRIQVSLQTDLEQIVRNKQTQHWNATPEQMAHVEQQLGTLGVPMNAEMRTDFQYNEQLHQYVDSAARLQQTRTLDQAAQNIQGAGATLMAVGQLSGSKELIRAGGAIQALASGISGMSLIAAGGVANLLPGVGLMLGAFAVVSGLFDDDSGKRDPVEVISEVAARVTAERFSKLGERFADSIDNLVQKFSHDLQRLNVTLRQNTLWIVENMTQKLSSVHADLATRIEASEMRIIQLNIKLAEYTTQAILTSLKPLAVETLRQINQVESTVTRLQHAASQMHIDARLAAKRDLINNLEEKKAQADATPYRRNLSQQEIHENPEYLSKLHRWAMEECCMKDLNGTHLLDISDPEVVRRYFQADTLRHWETLQCHLGALLPHAKSIPGVIPADVNMERIAHVGAWLETARAYVKHQAFLMDYYPVDELGELKLETPAVSADGILTVAATGENTLKGLEALKTNKRPLFQRFFDDYNGAWNALEALHQEEVKKANESFQKGVTSLDVKQDWKANVTQYSTYLNTHHHGLLPGIGEREIRQSTTNKIKWKHILSKLSDTQKLQVAAVPPEWALAEAQGLGQISYFFDCSKEVMPISVLIASEPIADLTPHVGKYIYYTGPLNSDRKMLAGFLSPNVRPFDTYGLSYINSISEFRYYQRAGQRGSIAGLDEKPSGTTEVILNSDQFVKVFFKDNTPGQVRWEGEVPDWDGMFGVHRERAFAHLGFASLEWDVALRKNLTRSSVPEESWKSHYHPEPEPESEYGVIFPNLNKIFNDTPSPPHYHDLQGWICEDFDHGYGSHPHRDAPSGGKKSVYTTRKLGMKLVAHFTLGSTHVADREIVLWIPRHTEIPYEHIPARVKEIMNTRPVCEISQVDILTDEIQTLFFYALSADKVGITISEPTDLTAPIQTAGNAHILSLRKEAAQKVLDQVALNTISRDLDTAVLTSHTYAMLTGMTEHEDWPLKRLRKSEDYRKIFRDYIASATLTMPVARLIQDTQADKDACFTGTHGISVDDLESPLALHLKQTLPLLREVYVRYQLAQPQNHERLLRERACADALHQARFTSLLKDQMKQKISQMGPRALGQSAVPAAVLGFIQREREAWIQREVLSDNEEVKKLNQRYRKYGWLFSVSEAEIVCEVQEILEAQQASERRKYFEEFLNDFLERRIIAQRDTPYVEMPAIDAGLISWLLGKVDAYCGTLLETSDIKQRHAFISKEDHEIHIETKLDLQHRRDEIIAEWDGALGPYAIIQLDAFIRTRLSQADLLKLPMEIQAWKPEIPRLLQMAFSDIRSSEPQKIAYENLQRHAPLYQASYQRLVDKALDHLKAINIVQMITDKLKELGQLAARWIEVFLLGDKAPGVLTLPFEFDAQVALINQIFGSFAELKNELQNRGRKLTDAEFREFEKLMAFSRETTDTQKELVLGYITHGTEGMSSLCEKIRIRQEERLAVHNEVIPIQIQSAIRGRSMMPDIAFGLTRDEDTWKVACMDVLHQRAELFRGTLGEDYQILLNSGEVGRLFTPILWEQLTELRDAIRREKLQEFSDAIAAEFHSGLSDAFDDAGISVISSDPKQINQVILDTLREVAGLHKRAFDALTTFEVDYLLTGIQNKCKQGARRTYIENVFGGYLQDIERPATPAKTVTPVMKQVIVEDVTNPIMGFEETKENNK